MSDDDHMLRRSRTQADRVAAQNARIQSGVQGVGRRPTAAAPTRNQPDGTRKEVVRKFTDHGLDAYSKMMGHLVENGPKGVRAGVGAAAALPGVVLDIADVARAKDKKREAFVKGAGILGGLAGGALGTGGGPVGSFVGGALGSEGAEWAAGKIYDHRDDIARYADDVRDDVGWAGQQMMDTTFGRAMYPAVRSAANSY